MYSKDNELNGGWSQLSKEYPRARSATDRRHAVLKAITLLGVATVLYWFFAPAKRLMSVGSGWPHHCNVESCRGLDFEFEDLDHFEFFEKFEDGTTSNGRFIGHIQLLTAPQEQASDIRLNVSISASNSVLSESVRYEKSKSSLTINLPRPWDQNSAVNPCLEVNVSIYLRPGLTLENLLLSSDASSIHIPKAVDVVIRNATDIRLHSGGLTAEPFFTSRETRIDVGAGSIHGQYPLYDLLSVQTSAGSVTINVIPKAADKKNPLPALFTASSHAGSVHVTYPPPGIEIPKREYHTSAHSGQGSVSGRFLHGVETNLKTNTGSIKADILPYAADNYKSSLYTQTNAGGQYIKLLSPYTDAGSKINRLSSTHHTGAASLHLEYPPEWEGKIDGSTAVGSLTLHGNVTIIEKGGLVGHYVRAEKGDGDSDMEFRTGAGSATVEMG